MMFRSTVFCDCWFSQSDWMELIKVEGGFLTACTHFRLVTRFKLNHLQSSHSFVSSSSSPSSFRSSSSSSRSICFIHSNKFVRWRLYISNISCTITFQNVWLYYKHYASNEWNELKWSSNGSRKKCTELCVTNCTLRKKNTIERIVMRSKKLIFI